MRRFGFVFAILLTLTAVVLPTAAKTSEHHKTFHLVEATIADIDRAFRSDLLEPEQLVRMYLARIAAYDHAGPHLNAFMHVTNKPELNVPPAAPFPAGFDPKDAPYGVTFSGRAFSEPRLIGLAYAFEQVTQHRQAPDSHAAAAD
jgi:Asp-tRNA(Asn)/Glu-tRNA(Gln) amidotransferase A subunit family amidase